MDKNNIVYFGKEQSPLDEFADFFVLKADTFNKEERVFIHADENLPYKDILELLKIIKDLEFHKVSLVTE